MVGVVFECYLVQVCLNYVIKVVKKNLGIFDLNEFLKSVEVIDVLQWRFIQYLGDVRNFCDYSKVVELMVEQVVDFVVGVKKVMKIIF